MDGLEAVSDQPSVFSLSERGGTMRDFREMKVWHKAHELALLTYRATESFPDSERYGMSSQLRRAATSIAANIAEGCGRTGEADFRRFLHIAMGSASEVEYLVLLARDLSFLPHEQHQSLHIAVTEVKRMLSGFISKLTADR